jgi:hypothetical protein
MALLEIIVKDFFLKNQAVAYIKIDISSCEDQLLTCEKDVPGIATKPNRFKC